MTPLLTKAFFSANAIAGYLIVAGAAGNVLSLATGPTDSLIGATDPLGVDAGKMADIVQVGEGEVRCGGDVDFGDPLTADANGKAVKAVPVEGAVVRIVGFAQGDGAEDDIIPYLAAPGVLNTPAAA